MARSMNFYEISFHVHMKQAHLNNEVPHRLYSCFGPFTKNNLKNIDGFNYYYYIPSDNRQHFVYK